MSGYNVDIKRWSKMSIFEQMGNIGSEVGRAFKAKRLSDEESCNYAVGRALDLFDATVSVLITTKPYRVKEILRAKDQFLQNIYGEEFNNEDSKMLENYFMQMAIAARLNK
ncbi:hypothetical protein DYH10_00800 [Candidatus Saccharibacteria bacterium CPR2]|nr:hypothetical protein [Candidatus Saccharibacteria bacterium CPR2]